MLLTGAATVNWTTCCETCIYSVSSVNICPVLTGESVSCMLFDVTNSYMIRSVAANASDQILCMQLAQNAVHAAMAGAHTYTVIFMILTQTL